jgi:hypothetical protein
MVTPRRNAITPQEKGIADMAWIESHQSLGTHRKLMALCQALHIDDTRAVGMLHYLWWWALDNAPDGNITGVSDKTLAVASHWKGSPDLWVTTLRQVGLVDEDATMRTLHNWEDYAGKLVSARERNKERQKTFRDKHRNVTVTVTSPLRNGATVPNPTQPNRITNVIHRDVTLPDFINKENWDAFLEMRKQKKEPATEYAMKLIINKLTKLQVSGEDPNEILNESIMNRWKGVFALKDGRKNDHGQPGRDSKAFHTPERYTRPEEL